MTGPCARQWNGNAAPLRRRTSRNAGNSWVSTSLGYECGSFHSWLCNALYKDVEESYGLKFNSFGLLENDWEEVCAMTAAIQGIGEPVVWTPCVVRRYAAE